MKKLTIITINYNNSIGLKRTLKSVDEQRGLVYEFIVIDGGSSDDSLNMIDSYNYLITKYISEKDNGVYNAMNKGIDMSTGDYILFLNSGDYFYNNKSLLNVSDKMDGTDLIAFNINLYSSDFNLIHKHPDELTSYFLFDETLAHQSVLIKRSLFEEFGLYDESLKIVSDWKFFLKVAFSGCTYKNYNHILTKFEFGGISTTLEGVKTRIKERDKVLKENYPFFYNDYKLHKKNEDILKMNRFKMLVEIEKSKYGRKFISLVLRLYLFLFSSKKLNNILESNDS